MRYMIFTTKHHEGFCMYNTKQTDFSIMNGPFGKDPHADVAKYIFDTFRDQGFMVGAYFSKPDWHSEYYWWPFSCFRHALPKSRLTQSSTRRSSSDCSSSYPTSPWLVESNQV